MKKGLFRRFLCGTLTGLMCLAGTVPQALEVSAADQTENYKEDGYDYELWNQNAQGSASMQSLGNGAFSCKWSNIENVLFRTGKKLGSTQDYKSYDGIYIDYDVDYNPQGNSYMCVYGWTENGKSDHPTVEYYIVEAWGSWRPPGSTTSLGTVTSDGKTYDIYRTERVNQPSIHGTETFYQYWSVQKTSPAANNETTHLEGTITVSNHFEAWENAGLDMSGKMYEVALNIEGYRSNGSATVNKNNLVFGSTPDPVKPAEPVEPDSDGYYFKSTFESGKDSWSGRGDASVATDASNYYGGKSSLKVSGRTDNWHGTAINLDPNAFTAGNTYSFGTAVMQNTEDSTDFKLTLQYTDASGEEHYDEVAHATASNGKWTALSNSSYTIPAGATGMILYVEAPDSLTDFYIDDAFGAVKGKNFTIDNTDVPTTTTTVTTTTVTTTTVTTTTVTTTEPVTTTTQPVTTTTQPVTTTTQPVTTTTQPVTTTTQPVTTTTQPDISVTKWGDTNLSGEVELGDAVLILQAISNPEKYGINGTDDTHITAQGMINGDVDQNGNGLTAKDALSIQKYIAKLIDELPES